MDLLFLLFSLQAASVCAYLSTYPSLDLAADTSNNTAKPIPIYFALMMSFGGSFNSSGAVPGVQVALDLINRDPTLLPGYSLHYTIADSQVKMYTHMYKIICIYIYIYILYVYNCIEVQAFTRLLC